MSKNKYESVWLKPEKKKHYLNLRKFKHLFIRLCIFQFTSKWEFLFIDFIIHSVETCSMKFWKMVSLLFNSMQQTGTVDSTLSVSSRDCLDNLVGIQDWLFRDDILSIFCILFATACFYVFASSQEDEIWNIVNEVKISHGCCTGW